MAWAAREGVAGVLICGPAGEAYGAGSWLSALGLSWKLLRNAPLPELAAILSTCGAFAGHDSGVTHLAAGTLALSGPTGPLVWRPRSERACILSPASPGPLGLRNLPVETVIRALRALLDGAFAFNPSSLGPTRLQVPAQITPSCRSLSTSAAP